MRKIITGILAVFIFFNPLITTVAAQPTHNIEGKVLIDNLLSPLRVATGDRGEVYILDGPELKKYENGKLTTMANLINSAKYFAPYGLDDLEDLYSFRPGTMIYMDGAVYVMGYMVDMNIPPIIKPGRFGDGHDFGTGIILGNVYLVTLKITDHFEPVDVPYFGMKDQPLDYGLPFWRFGRELAITKREYDALMLNDPAYTKDWQYSDYTALFRNSLIIPNLVKAPGGKAIVIKPTMLETRYHASSNGSYYWDYQYSNKTLNDVKTILGSHAPYVYDPLERETTSRSILGAYYVWPNNKQQLINEGFISNEAAVRNDASTIEKIVTVFNKYTMMETDLFPDNNTIYALPSYTDPENTLILCNSTYIWKYDLKTATYDALEFVAGNQMKTSNADFLIPSLHYSPTHPRPTEDLGIFFLGLGSVWRLYKDKYWQDLSGEGLVIPFNTTLDWAIDEENRIAYVLTTNNELVSYDFSPIIAKTPASKTSAENNTKRPYSVMLDKSLQTMYLFKDPNPPPINDGKFYVPAIAIFNLLGINSVIEESTPIDDIFELIPLKYSRRGTKATIKGYIYSKDNSVNTQIWADIFDVLDVVYQLTGQRYSYSFDETTNTLYINSEHGTISLFNGWNKWR